MHSIRASYFPPGMVYILSPLCVMFGIYIISTSMAWGIIMFIVATLLITTHYNTYVDVNRKEYGDYLSVLGIRFNEEKGRFGQIDRVVVTKEVFTYKASTRSRDRVGNYSAYTAVLFFGPDHKLELTTATGKHEVLKKIKPLCLALAIDVEDQSVADPYLIDIAQVS
jgi:hypothetical protein